MSGIDGVLSKVLALESSEKLQLMDQVLSSFYPTNKGVDKEWENESEERIRSHEQGSLPVLDKADVFLKYKK